MPSVRCCYHVAYFDTHYYVHNRMGLKLLSRALTIALHETATSTDTLYDGVITRVLWRYSILCDVMSDAFVLVTGKAQACLTHASGGTCVYVLT